MSIIAQVSGNSDLFLSRCADEENLRKSLSRPFCVSFFHKKAQERTIEKENYCCREVMMLAGGGKRRNGKKIKF